MELNLCKPKSPKKHQSKKEEENEEELLIAGNKLISIFKIADIGIGIVLVVFWAIFKEEFL